MFRTTSFTSLLSILRLLVVPSVVNGAAPTPIGAVDANIIQAETLTAPISIRAVLPVQQPKSVKLVQPVQPAQPAKPNAAMTTCATLSNSQQNN